jgi:hypothetical protein
MTHAAPMIPTGTQLWDSVKHLALASSSTWVTSSAGRSTVSCRVRSLVSAPSDGSKVPNLTLTFGLRPTSRAQIVAPYRRARAHADATIDMLALDAIGHAPWWPEGVTLHEVLVHAICETHRHAGHADVVGELIDGSVGQQPGNANVAPGDREWWESYRRRLERVAQEVAQD